MTNHSTGANSRDSAAIGLLPISGSAVVASGAAAATIFVDSSGIIVDASLQTASLFGYEPAELIGMRVETLMPERFREYHVPHRERFFAGSCTRPMGSGLELKARRKDGSELEVDISLTPEVHDGQARTMVVVREEPTGRHHQSRYATPAVSQT